MARGRKRAIKFKLKKGSVTSTASVLLILAALLTGLLLYSGSNSAPSNYIKHLFGWGSWFIPVLLIFTGLILWRRLKLPLIELRVLFGALTFWVSFLLLGSYISIEKGGVLAGALYSSLTRFIPALGILFIAVAGFLISFIISFNASIENALKFISWLLRAIASLFMVLFKAIIGLFKSLQEAAVAKKTEAEVAADIDDPDIEIIKPVSELKIKGANFEIIDSPREPVTEETPKTAEPFKKRELGEKVTLKEETVTNMPFSDHVWEYPPLTLLSDAPIKAGDYGDPKLRAGIIENTLDSFGIRAKVVEVNPGPAVTQYALESPIGTKIAKVVSLQNDLAMALSSPNGQVRVEAPIPGRSLVGIEVPNFSPSLVTLRNVLTSEVMKNSKSKLTVALGLDVAGTAIMADITRMPHILVAGSTGSGKSVLINAFISSILFRASPSEVKFILIDPKRVEFTAYEDIPHLITPVITEPDNALKALRWAVSEMERRYRLFESAKVRNISGYNELSGFQALPYIVIVVDEFADLMHVAPVEIEKSICRLAQMARAVGIHLVLATQRPSVDVLTGLIKANIPTRVAFNVTSQIDSRVIIDQPGAEKLLGRGDMLYVPPEASKPKRIQGVYVSDAEINGLTEFLRNSNVTPEYKEEVINPKLSVDTSMGGDSATSNDRDELFSEAKSMVQQNDTASSSLLQRRFKIGYARAARLLDQLEAAGIVSAPNGSKPRDVLSRGDSEG
ncbi:MAG: DNA translocase FtsK [candidate division WWE3 bacterium]|nr:DNA translocase FtsK [candidate division WWE3 bacterium]